MNTERSEDDLKESGSAPELTHNERFLGVFDSLVSIRTSPRDGDTAVLSGAVDRKHQMIFDGDIVLWYFNDHGGNDRVLAYEVTCRNEYQEYLPCGFLLKGTLKPLSREVMDDLEVVGNVYDNPDLIAEYKAKDDALADKRSY